MASPTSQPTPERTMDSKRPKREPSPSEKPKKVNSETRKEQNRIASRNYRQKRKRKLQQLKSLFESEASERRSSNVNMQPRTAMVQASPSASNYSPSIASSRASPFVPSSVPTLRSSSKEEQAAYAQNSNARSFDNQLPPFARWPSSPPNASSTSQFNYVPPIDMHWDSLAYPSMNHTSSLMPVPQQTPFAAPQAQLGFAQLPPTTQQYQNQQFAAEFDVFGTAPQYYPGGYGQSQNMPNSQSMTSWTTFDSFLLT